MQTCCQVLLSSQTLRSFSKNNNDNNKKVLNNSKCRRQQVEIFVLGDEIQGKHKGSVLLTEVRGEVNKEQDPGQRGKSDTIVQSCKLIENQEVQVQIDRKKNRREVRGETLLISFVLFSSQIISTFTIFIHLHIDKHVALLYKDNSHYDFHKAKLLCA